MTKQILSVKIDTNIYRQLKNEIGKGNVSSFVEKAVAKELGNYENKLDREQKAFREKLIAGYKRSAQSKSLKKESKL
jgi:hypothetical protein